MLIKTEKAEKKLTEYYLRDAELTVLVRDVALEVLPHFDGKQLTKRILTAFKKALGTREFEGRDLLCAWDDTVHRSIAVWPSSLYDSRVRFSLEGWPHEYDFSWEACQKENPWMFHKASDRAKALTDAQELLAEWIAQAQQINAMGEALQREMAPYECRYLFSE